jgi:hypothetical protein
MDNDEHGKATYDDSTDGRSLGDDQVSPFIFVIVSSLSLILVQSQKDARKAGGLTPEVV